MPSLSRHHGRRILLLLLVLLAVAVASRGDDSYTVSACRWQPYLCGGVRISYPFYLAGETKAVPGRPGESYCGYPGLAVRCDGGSKAVLRLGGGNNYTVSGIDYANLTVSLADADAAAGGGCPSVDHNVTVPAGVPLAFNSSVVDYLSFFVGCSFGPDQDPPRPPKPPTLKPITCGGADKAPGGSGPSSFVVPRGDVPPGDWPSACRQVFEVPVLKASIPPPPDAEGPGWRNDGYGQAIRAGFQLGWDRRSGPCGQCEQSNGMCGYNRTGEFLGCLCAGPVLGWGDRCGRSGPPEP